MTAVTHVTSQEKHFDFRKSLENLGVLISDEHFGQVSVLFSFSIT